MSKSNYPVSVLLTIMSNELYDNEMVSLPQSTSVTSIVTSSLSKVSCGGIPTYASTLKMNYVGPVQFS